MIDGVAHPKTTSKGGGGSNRPKSVSRPPRQGVSVQPRTKMTVEEQIATAVFPSIIASGSYGLGDSARLAVRAAQTIMGRDNVTIND